MIGKCPETGRILIQTDASEIHDGAAIACEDCGVHLYGNLDKDGEER